MTALFRAPARPLVEASAIPPRPYQLEALDALDAHLASKPTNPCVVLPTGAGKSLVIAWAIQRWKHRYTPLRVAILAHRKELVKQNAEELRGLWPGGDVGIYSAGLGRRDRDASILYASIDSAWNRWGEFAPFDVVLIDEAHRIPAKGEGKYRSFISGCRTQNQAMRVVGFTATPHRMGLGPICHKDHVLHEVCYEANVGDLIRDGYLCRLRSRAGAAPDLSGVRTSGGDYVTSSLSQAIDVPEVVRHAVREAVAAIRAEKRKSVVFFCVDVSHCASVAAELRCYGIDAPIVTAKTAPAERDRIAERFKAGGYQCLINVNVFTEGFNARRVDCVVLLRPTKSAGLYAQMVGRGLRLHPDKEDCLVLDFARCIETHGPLDCLEAGQVRVIVCGSVECCESFGTEDCQHRGCGDTFSRALGACPNCGWVIPAREVAREAAEVERQRVLHERQAAELEILGSQPREVAVDDVSVHRHRKPGSPDSLCVQYRCGLLTYREWICLDHPGPAGAKARAWWAARFGAPAWPVRVDHALDMFLEPKLKALTEAVTVVRSGKYFEVVAHKLRKAP